MTQTSITASNVAKKATGATNARSYAKKLAVISNASTPINDGKENLEEASLDQKLDTFNCITCNIKLNKNNEKVSALIDSGSEANLISQWVYSVATPRYLGSFGYDQNEINQKTEDFYCWFWEQ